eukprot:TRINITY_DN18342_c0_g1_i1.p1 TRINITY_DN18342_c0_g1~~TRINITY_DN18342_c0_g1_i1.p1  ORF type:complete len:224 (+),score=31.75 TRINITY_DN18342_c0_g1_i1:40-711(+)
MLRTSYSTLRRTLYRGATNVSRPAEVLQVISDLRPYLPPAPAFEEIVHKFTHDNRIGADEFISWQETCKNKSSLVNGVVTFDAMGGTVMHTKIIVRLIKLLSHRLVAPCDVFTDIALKLDTRNVRFPDVMVVCEELFPEQTFVQNPTVIFEVLSKSTSKTDLNEKLREYQRIASLEVYCCINQDKSVWVFERARGWTKTQLLMGDVIHWHEFQLELSDLFAGL